MIPEKYACSQRDRPYGTVPKPHPISLRFQDRDESWRAAICRRMSNPRSQLSQDGSEDRSRRQSGSTRVPDTLQRSSPGRRAIAAEVAPGTGPEADVPSWARKMTDLLPGLENLDTCRSAHWSTRALLSPNTPQSRNQSRASRAVPLQPLLTVADVGSRLGFAGNSGLG